MCVRVEGGKCVCACGGGYVCVCVCVYNLEMSHQIT